MAVLKPRERLVYFRVSEDEFKQFVSVCEQGGARSVSDLARSAVQRLIADGQRERTDGELDERMRRLERLIAAVTEQLNLLSVNHNGLGNLSDHNRANGQTRSDVPSSDGGGGREN